MAPKHKKKGGHKKKDGARKPEFKTESKGSAPFKKAEKLEKGLFRKDGVMPPLIDEDEKHDEDDEDD